MTKLTKDDMHLMRATLSNIENVDEDPYYILIHADKYINQEERMKEILEGQKSLDLLEFINAANYQHTAQYSVTPSGNFCIQMTALSPYERIAFGTFFEFFNREVSYVGKVPNAGKIFGF